jgi:hypothetical protein
MQLGFWLFAYAFCSTTEFTRLNIAWAAGYGLAQFLTLNEHRKLIDQPEKLRQMLTTLVRRLGLASLLMAIAVFFVMDSNDRIYALLTVALAAQYLLQLPGQSMAVGMRQVRLELLFRLLGPTAFLILGLPAIAIAGLTFLPVLIGVIGVTIALMLGLIFHLYGGFLWPRPLQVHSFGSSTVKGVYLFHVAMDAGLYPALFFILSKVHAGRETELGLRLLITVSGVVISALAMHAYMHRSKPLVRDLWRRATLLCTVLWLGWALEILLGGEFLGFSAIWALWMAILVWQLALSLVGVLSLVVVERQGQRWFSSRAITHHALVASVALWIHFSGGGGLTQGALSVLLWLMSGILLTMVWPPVKKDRDEF